MSENQATSATQRTVGQRLMRGLGMTVYGASTLYLAWQAVTALPEAVYDAASGNPEQSDSNLKFAACAIAAGVTGALFERERRAGQPKKTDDNCPHVFGS